jgi:Flp pilus assembly protein TadG
MTFRGQNARRGGTAIETALVLIPLTMFLFGVFEYGRLLMVWSLTNNAAREGCRYAIVNNTAATITTDVTNVATAKMAGQQVHLTGFTVSVSGTHAGNSATVTSLVPGDMITVTVSGQYQFMSVIPTRFLPSTLNISSSCSMLCEGGT